MLKKIKVKYLFIFLSILSSLNLSSMNILGNLYNLLINNNKKIQNTKLEIEPEAEPLSEKEKEKIKKLLVKIKASKTKTKNIKYFDTIKQENEEFKKEQQQILEENRKNIITQLKNQNTILLKFENTFALYKGDIIKGSLFALDFLSEYLMYKKLFDQKIDYTLKSIKENAKDLEKLVEKAEFSKKINNINLFNLRLSPEMITLKNYIKNNHKVIGYNPFKINLLPTIAFNITKTKILSYIENKLLTKFNYTHLYDPEINNEHFSAYEKGKDGNLNKMDITPFSIITPLMWILNPKYMIERLPIDKSAILQNINNLLGLNISNFMFSSSAKAIASITSLGLAIKLTDSILNESWATYIINNQIRFLKLLKEYNKLDENNTTEVEKTEKKLRKFIIQGHSQAVYQAWLYARRISMIRIGLITCTPVIGSLAYKGYQFYKNITTLSKESNK